ncbi:MAG TPA: hypothetical protein HPP94_15060 [Desulfuromonadales bacterium]|nr:hypothetical protein [Desulfuromonadales bacterium]
MLTRWRTYTSEQKTQFILSLVIGLVVFLYHYLARQERVETRELKLQGREAHVVSSQPAPVSSTSNRSERFLQTLARFLIRRSGYDKCR